MLAWLDTANRIAAIGPCEVGYKLVFQAELGMCAMLAMASNLLPKTLRKTFTNSSATTSFPGVFISLRGPNCSWHFRLRIPLRCFDSDAMLPWIHYCILCYPGPCMEAVFIMLFWSCHLLSHWRIHPFSRSLDLLKLKP